MRLLFKAAHDNINLPFTVPRAVEIAKTEYLDESDVVNSFLGEAVDKTNNEKDTIKAGELLNLFKSSTRTK